IGPTVTALQSHPIQPHIEATRLQIALQPQGEVAAVAVGTRNEDTWTFGHLLWARAFALQSAFRPASRACRNMPLYCETVYWGPGVTRPPFAFAPRAPHSSSERIYTRPPPSPA